MSTATISKVGEVARRAYAAGISVIPPREDGTKAPFGSWGLYMTQLPYPSDIEQWWGTHTGLGFITGSISGNLELFELDADFYDEFYETASGVGLGPLVDRIVAGYLEKTPGNGWHLLYRCDQVEGNTKLAQKPGPINPTTGKPTSEVLIETRGEGGFVVVAPSNGRVHPTGGRYEMISGSIETIARITIEEREQLFSLARTFDRMPIESNASQFSGKLRMTATSEPSKNGPRPGDDYNARHSWDALLTPRGWTKLHTRGETTYWRRPGKSEGWSATTNHAGSGLLWVFTTSSEFDASRSYDLFGAYATLEHGGAFEVAAKCLGEQGYGSPKRSTRGSGAGKAPPPVAAPAEELKPDRPSIEINTEWHESVKLAVEALASDAHLYHRGDTLVRVVQETKDADKISSRTTLKGLAGSPKIIKISDSNVGVTLTSVAEFFRWKKDQSGEFISVGVGPPDWLIKAVATRKHWPGIRELLAVAECPFPRPDGTIVETKGYDAETGTLYAPSIEFPSVPANPNRTDAQEAWDRIRLFVADFPFATEDDEAVYLAGVLTIIARPCITGPVPGIAVIGNKAGTGKGLLVDAMVMPGTGRPCPTSTYPDSSEEAAKVKVGIAKAGKAAVHFDNLERGAFYGGGPLDSALTTTVIDDRQLGGNESPPLPLRTAWFLSGNNVHPCQDAYRRWLVCRLETEHDHPERRKDIKIPDLRKFILEHRGEIVRDALTILKAHARAAHFAPDWDGFGSFEDWSNIVRGAVWFATGRDCLVSQRGTDEDSDERRADISLLEGWLEMPGGSKDAGGLTTSQVLQSLRDNPKLYPTLLEALLARGNRGEMPSSQSLGKILRGLKNTPIGDYILREAGRKDGAVKWAVACKRPAKQTEDTEDTEDTSKPRTRNSDSHDNVNAYESQSKNGREAAETSSVSSASSVVEDPLF